MNYVNSACVWKVISWRCQMTNLVPDFPRGVSAVVGENKNNPAISLFGLRFFWFCPQKRKLAKIALKTTSLRFRH